MAANFLFLVSFGLLHIARGHGNIEPLPSDPSWCVNGNILEIGECLCEREKEDSCVGSRCFRQMGLSWYKPSCKDCKCKPVTAKPSASKNENENTATQQPPAQCGGGPQASSCGGGGDDGKGMPDWFGKDKPKEKKPKKKGSRFDKPKNVPRPAQHKPQTSNEEPKARQRQANAPDAELLRLLQSTQSPLEAERSRRHTIVAVVSFGFAAFFAFLFYSARSGKPAEDGSKADTKSKDATSTTTTSKDSASKEASSKEASSKDSTSKDSTGKDATSKDATSKDNASTAAKAEPKPAKSDDNESTETKKDAKTDE